MRSKRAAPDVWQKLRPKARAIRHESTVAEERLWEQLRGRKLRGLKFRRQHTIDRFVVDFYCADAGLVIEIDGAVHDEQREQDEARQARLETLGLRVLRFKNESIMTSLRDVLNSIAQSVENNSPSPHCGEGAGGVRFTC